MRYLVFSSGGVKGLAHIGMLHALDTVVAKTCHTQRTLGYSGCSAGAVIALLCCLGYTSSELVSLALEENLANILTLNRLASMLGGHATGLDTGKGLVQLLSKLVKTRTGARRMTFRELWELTGGKELWVVATNITKKVPEYYSFKTTPDMDVVDAVRRSVSVPILFTAPRDAHTGDWFSDGALMTSIPCSVFRFYPVQDVAVFVVSTTATTTASSKTKKVFEYVTELLQFIRHVHSVHIQRVHDISGPYRYLTFRASCSSCATSMFDFSLSTGSKLKLIQAGVRAVAPEALLSLPGICNKRRSRPCKEPSPRCKLSGWQPWHAPRKRTRMPKKFRIKQKDHEV